MGYAPSSLVKADSLVGRLRWLIMRIAKSRLAEGVSRRVLQRMVEHFWECIGKAMCQSMQQAVLASEGRRASGDHTYHVVSNLSARNEFGKQVPLKASLLSIVGEHSVLGHMVRDSPYTSLL